MPEYPDLTVYVEHIERRVKGDRLTGVRLTSPFLLRSVTPGVDEVAGREVIGVQRLAKQLVLALADGYFVVIHLMIAGRLRWHDAKPNAPPQAVPKRNGLAAFDFETGSLIFYRGQQEEARVLAVGPRRDGARRLGSGRPRGLRHRLRCLLTRGYARRRTPSNGR